eukprot:m.1194042 g.1194042  ORF g.1194042 m.1194042 type:complete len:468 (-) comp24559_c0_seq9:2711-4114(-)
MISNQDGSTQSFSTKGETTPLIVLPLKRPIPSSRWERRKNAYFVTLIYLTAMIAMGLVYAAQGPATLRLAEQADLVHGNATAKDVSKLTIMGIVNAADAIAALVGTLLGGYLVDRTCNWHYILSAYLVWQGLSFACFTLATNLWQLTLASLAWGLASTMPSLSTQAAMTWVWKQEVAPFMQLNNAAFGVGAIAAPALVSWNLRERESFHLSYWAIAGINILVAILPLLVKSPQRLEGIEEEDFEHEPISSIQAARCAISTAENKASLAVAAGNVPPVRLGKSLSTNSETVCQVGQDASDSDHTVTRSRNLKMSPPFTFYTFFGFYVATEIGLANWIASFAQINGIQHEVNAALLVSVYYGAFTVTRVLAAVMSSYISSRRLLAVCLMCATVRSTAFFSHCAVFLTCRGCSFWFLKGLLCQGWLCSCTRRQKHIALQGRSVRCKHRPCSATACCGGGCLVLIKSDCPC